MQTQRLGNTAQGFTVLGQQFDGAIICPVHDAANFLIKDARCSFTIFARTICQRGTCNGIFTLAVGDSTKTFTHTPTCHHLTCNSSNTLKIVLRSGGDMTNSYLFGRSATKGSDQLRFEVVLRVVVAIIQRRILSYTQSLTTRYNCDLSNGVN